MIVMCCSLPKNFGRLLTLYEVKLVAVDHPADVSIFTNEKVGSPEMAAHRVHTVKNPRLPVSAKDGFGRDLFAWPRLRIRTMCSRSKAGSCRG